MRRVQNLIFVFLLAEFFTSLFPATSLLEIFWGKIGNGRISHPAVVKQNTSDAETYIDGCVHLLHLGSGALIKHPLSSYYRTFNDANSVQSKGGS